MTSTDITPDPLSESAVNWYYERNGKRIGPVPEDVIKKQLDWGNLTPDTLIWHRSFGTEWRPLRSTELVSEGVEPPPLPASRVNSTFAWLLAILPLAGAGVERVITDAGNISLTGSEILFGYVITNSILSLIDAANIEKSGRNVRNIHLWAWAILFVPVYLLQRKSRTRPKTIALCDMDWLLGDIFPYYYT
jgi:hypothetical protein